MAWTAPKTDWAVQYDASGNYTGDFFNAADYARIKGNLEYLRALASTVGARPADMEIPTVTVASYGYASTFDVLERALDKLLESGVFDPGVPERKTWAGNQATPLAADINRIEGSCQKLFDVLTRQADARQKLAFKLGLEVF